MKNVAALLKLLKKKGLDRFVRTKQEINKQALLAEEEVAATLSGVKISQREEFFIKPEEAKGEITAVPGKDRLKITVPKLEKKSKKR